MKKVKKFFIILTVIVFTMIGVIGSYMILAQSQAKAELKKESIRKMLLEIERERKKIETERQELDQVKNNLKSYEMELEKRHDQYLKATGLLKTQQEEFNQKINQAGIDKQIIETYENIEPGESAKLILDLYKKDPNLTVRLLRRISGRKAGKILQEMIVIDQAAAADLAKKTLDIYTPQG